MKKTILVVDDIPIIRKALIHILTKAHYQVVGEAEDGQEAVDKFEALNPNLVLMDMVMPKMSGLEAARLIFKIEKKAKIIVISAMSQESIIMESIYLGVLDYIVKPFLEVDVIRAVDRVLLGEEYILAKNTTEEV